MGTLADAYVRIRWDTKGLASADLVKPAQAMGTRAGSEAGRNFGLSFKSVMLAGVAAATAVAGSQVAGFFKQTVTAASNVAESQNKVAVVFGKSTKAVLDFGKNSATSMGLSKASYLAAAGTLGNLFVALKLPQAEAARMSTKMIKLAGDMASFNNVSPEEALAALQSGLVGETEPLRKFGVNLNDATIKAQAMKMGIISSTKEALTPAQKATATYALILAQTGTAQGDFTRTSKGLANQQRILKAKFDDLKATIGEKLLPTVTRFTNWLTDKGVPAVEGFITGMKNGTGSGGQFADVLKRISDIAQASVTFIKDHKVAVLSLVGAFATATAAVKAFNVVLAIMDVLMNANPISLIIIATVASIAAWIAIIVTAYNKLTWFHDGVNLAWKSISKATDDMWNQHLKPMFKQAGEGADTLYTGHFKPAAANIESAWKTISASARTAWQTIIYPTLKALQDFIRNNVAPTVLWLANNVFKPAWQVIQIAVSIAWAAMKVWFGLIQIAIKLIGSVLTTFYNSAWKPVWTAVTSIVSMAWNNQIKPVLTAFGNYFKVFLAPAIQNFGKVAAAVWAGISNTAKAPIKFVVNTVLNDGLLAAYNTLAKAFHVKPDNVHVATHGFAGGGLIPGQPSEVDNMVVPGPGGRPTGLATGEFVVRASQTRKHLDTLKKINSGQYAGYAAGGIVGDVMGALSDPVGFVLKKAKGVLGRTPGSSVFTTFAKNAAGDIFNGVTSFLKKLIVSGPLGGGNAGTGRFSPQPNGWPGANGNQPPWSANVAQAASFIRKTWPGITAGSYVSGMASSDHYPKAIDNMTSAHNAAGLARGNALASWFVQNPGAYGTKYVIWNKRITSGRGWENYSVAGQGDHSDHVHLSFFGKGGRVTKMAGGGVINEPIWGVGRSGRRYQFGESGPETVTPGTGGAPGVTMTFNVSGDVGPAQVREIKSHVDDAFGKLLTQIRTGRRR